MESKTGSPNVMPKPRTTVRRGSDFRVMTVLSLVLILTHLTFAWVVGQFQRSARNRRSEPIWARQSEARPGAIWSADRRGRYWPVICFSVAKKDFLRSVLMPQFTGGDWY